LCPHSTQQYDEVKQDKDLHYSDLVYLTSVIVTRASATMKDLGLDDHLSQSTVCTVLAQRPSERVLSKISNVEIPKVIKKRKVGLKPS
jgi:hypothetical protein